MAGARDSRGRFLGSGRSFAADGVTIVFTLDQKSMDRAMARIGKYDLKNPTVLKRARRVYLEGAKMLVGPMRREAPKGATGNLRASIAARNPKLRPGEMAVASVGPRGGRGKGAHRFFVTRGTQLHTLEPVRRGEWVVIPQGSAPVGGIGPRMANVYAGKNVRHPGAKANPFVDRTTERYGGQVQSFIARNVAGTGIGTYMDGVR